MSVITETTVDNFGDWIKQNNWKFDSTSRSWVIVGTNKLVPIRKLYKNYQSQNNNNTIV